MFSMEHPAYLKKGLPGFLTPHAVEIHVTKHHQAYIDTANKLIVGSGLEGKPIEEVIQKAQGPLFNNVAQHFNHSFFWRCLQPETIPVTPKVADVLAANFESVEKFKETFTAKASTVFGSGWCYLYKSKDGKCEIGQYSNALNPVKDGHKPLLTVDTWEHAWYIDYENRKAEYFKNFWNHVNWNFVEQNMLNAAGYTPPPPTFIPDLYENDFNERLEVDSRKNLEIEVSFSNLGIISGNRTRRAYFRSSLIVDNTQFNDCYAFGQGYTFGSGGGIYISSSNIYSSKSTWIYNIANIGGALSGIGSNIIISENNFEQNHAIYSAGALSSCYNSQGYLTELDELSNSESKFDNEPNLQISNTVFKENICDEYAGATHIVRNKIADIIDSKFLGNSACISGGAIIVDSTTISFARCDFLHNFINSEKREILHKNTILKGSLVGGGAISLNSQHANLGNSDQKFQLTTISCNFGNNSASILSIHPLGGDILFTGNASLWRSTDDCFSEKYDIAGEVLIFMTCDRECPKLPISHADDPTNISFPSQISISYDSMSPYEEPPPYTPPPTDSYSPLPTPKSVPSLNTKLPDITNIPIVSVTFYTPFPTKSASPIPTDFPTTTSSSEPTTDHSKPPTKSSITPKPSEVPSSLTITIIPTETDTQVITHTMIITDTFVQSGTTFTTTKTEKFTDNFISTKIETNVTTYTHASDDRKPSNSVAIAARVIITVLSLILIIIIAGYIYMRYKRKTDYDTFSTDLGDNAKTSYLTKNIKDLSSYTNDNSIVSTESLLLSDDTFDPDFSESSMSKDVELQI